MKYKKISLPIITLSFILLLAVFMLNAMGPYTEAELADEAARLERLNALMESGEEMSENDLAYVLKKTANTKYALKILPHRTTVYIVSMAVIAAAYILWLTYMSIKKISFHSFASAFFILLAIGVSYQYLFLMDTQFVIMLALAMVAAVTVFFLWRRINWRSDIFFWLVAAAILLLLLGNLLMGSEHNGATLWIEIGGISFQPGEFVKALLIVLGAISYKNKKRATVFCFLSVVSCGTLLLLRDLGNTMAIFCMFTIMTYLLFDRRVVSLLIIAAAVIALCVAVNILPYAKVRMESWGNAMTSSSDHCAQQKATITSVIFGGVNGLGISFPLTDTYVASKFAASSDTAVAGIMAVFGMPFMAIVMLCYTLLVIQPAFNRSVHASSHLILVQFSTLVCVQVLLNFCGSLDLLPFTGIVAPLISNGGSALITFSALSGLCVAAMVPSVKNKKEISNA